MNIPVNGAALHIAIDGPADKPCVTFVTGIANDHTLWNQQVAALAGDYRLIRIDSRGHGLSTATPPPYSLAQLVSDVVAVWDALAIGRSVIVGLGLGGIVAREVALHHPGRVSGLVPVSCRAQMTPQYDAIWPPLVEAATKGGIEAIADMTIARWFSEEYRNAHPAIIKEVRDAILRTKLDGYLGCIAAIRTLGHADRLKNLRMPVLYVSGEFDRAGAPPAIVQEVCDATPGAKHVVLPGATHISTVCNPTVFNAAMRDFLRTVYR
jgi:3-oxoadipate enol-lactonase